MVAGTKDNYTFTLVRDEAHPDDLWCATADPIWINPDANRRLWVSQAGQIYSAPAGTVAAITTDPMTPPAGWTLYPR